MLPAPTLCWSRKLWSEREASVRFSNLLCKLSYPDHTRKELRKAMDTANRFLPAQEALVKAFLRANSRTSLERLCIHVSRFELVITFFLFGVLKFTAGEAQGIPSLVPH